MTFPALEACRLISARGKEFPKAFAYQIGEEPGKYGLDVYLQGQPRIDEARMAVFIPYADGNRRDGVGDLLDVQGIDHSRHRRNPIVLYDHGKEVTLPVGMSEDPDTGEYCIESDPLSKTEGGWCHFYQGKENKQTKAYEAEGVTMLKRDPTYSHGLFCEQLFDLMAKKLVRGGSIGYTIVEGIELPADYATGTPQGLHLRKVKMLEFSAVVLPCNQDTVNKNFEHYFKGMGDTARQILAMPRVCGKKLSPYLIKSLSRWMVEAKSQVLMPDYKALKSIRAKYKSQGDDSAYRRGLSKERRDELDVLGQSDAAYWRGEDMEVSAPDYTGLTAEEIRYRNRRGQFHGSQPTPKDKAMGDGLGPMPYPPKKQEEAPKESDNARRIRENGIDKVEMDTLGPNQASMLDEQALEDAQWAHEDGDNHRFKRGSQWMYPQTLQDRHYRARYDFHRDRLQAEADAQQNKAIHDPRLNKVELDTAGIRGEQDYTPGLRDEIDQARQAGREMALATPEDHTVLFDDYEDEELSRQTNARRVARQAGWNEVMRQRRQAAGKAMSKEEYQRRGAEQGIPDAPTPAAPRKREGLIQYGPDKTDLDQLSGGGQAHVANARQRAEEDHEIGTAREMTNEDWHYWDAMARVHTDAYNQRLRELEEARTVGQSGDKGVKSQQRKPLRKDWLDEIDNNARLYVAGARRTNQPVNRADEDDLRAAPSPYDRFHMERVLHYDDHTDDEGKYTPPPASQGKGFPADDPRAPIQRELTPEDAERIDDHAKQVVGGMSHEALMVIGPYKQEFIDRLKQAGQHHRAHHHERYNEHAENRLREYDSGQVPQKPKRPPHPPEYYQQQMEEARKRRQTQGKGIKALTSLPDKLRNIGEELAAHTDPAPMPGYGQIYLKDGEVWYVGGDGDEDGFVDLVQKKLGSLPGVTSVRCEAEGFPPDDEGWQKVYPAQRAYGGKSAGSIQAGIKALRRKYGVRAD